LAQKGTSGPKGIIGGKRKGSRLSAMNRPEPRERTIEEKKKRESGRGLSGKEITEKKGRQVLKKEGFTR